MRNPMIAPMSQQGEPGGHQGGVHLGRERLRQILAAHRVTFQRTRPGRSNDPHGDAKLDRIDNVLEHHPTGASRSTSSGHRAIRPMGRSAAGGAPQRPGSELPPAPWQFHGCYSVGDDTLWGAVRRQKSAVNVQVALRSIRARRPDGEAIYVILDTCRPTSEPRSASGPPASGVELCFTPPTAHGQTRSKPTSGRNRVRAQRLELPEPCPAHPPAARPPAWRNANA